MAQKKTPPTLTRLWQSVTDIRDGLSRAKAFGEQHKQLLANQYTLIDARRHQLEGTLTDLSPSQRSQVVSRAVGGSGVEQVDRVDQKLGTPGLAGSSEIVMRCTGATAAAGSW